MVGSKKRDECSEEARTRLLDAAQMLFAVHGFHATTTKAIAEQAEVPGGLIFYYFPTKQALLAGVLSEQNILVELRTVGETLTVPDPRAALIALSFDPLHFVENMVDILLCRLVKIV